MLLVGDVVGPGRPHVVGDRLAGGHEPVEHPVRHPALGTVREDQVLGLDLVAVRQRQGVGVPAREVGRHVPDAVADPVGRSGVLRALAEPVVHPCAVESIAEAVVRRVHSGGVDRHGLGRPEEVGPVEFLEDHLVGDLLGIEVHDVDPVVEHAGGVRRVRPQVRPVGPGDALLDHDGVGTSLGCVRRRRHPGRSTSDDGHVDAFHTLRAVLAFP